MSADAVVVFGGHDGRVAVGAELVRRGFEAVVPADVEFVAAPYPLLRLPAALVKEAGKLAYAATRGRSTSGREASRRGQR